MWLKGNPDVQMVTNDEFRDHFWRMRQPHAFLKWRERHITRYHVLSDRTEGAETDTEMVIQAACLKSPVYGSPDYQIDMKWAVLPIN